MKRLYSVEVYSSRELSVTEPLHIVLERGVNVFTVASADIGGLTESLTSLGLRVRSTNCIEQPETSPTDLYLEDSKTSEKQAEFFRLAAEMAKGPDPSIGR